VPAPPTIGVFDSGFGGLTVLRALLPLLPHARFLYLGDTARLPYGSKSRETIARYAVSSARFLLDGGADLLVIACNTATALALEDIRIAAAPIPVLGVIEPGAQAGLAAPPTLALAPPNRAAPSPSGPLIPTPSAPPEILVLATPATVQSRAYTHALLRLGLPAIEKACPLLVPLVEEGWIDHPVTREVVRIYLAEALAGQPRLHTLLLGCTHYPLLRPIFEQTLASLNRPLRLIDSAQATAHTVATHLQALTSSLQDPNTPHRPAPPRTDQPTPPPCTFYATDSVEKFAQLGSHFLGQPLPHVHLIDLGG